ncbi:MAG: 3'-5' exonuclease domain-containing protein 2, partial [Muribaculaceae bacterium]|nr:3'-5' exonuclease domain-containing protein 2 [Muribaculaceae bacterium]
FVKDYQIADNSLQKIYGVIFNQRISKNQRLTNWEAQELTENQQHYAAIDAWACQRIYNHLVAGNFNPDASPYEIIETESHNA